MPTAEADAAPLGLLRPPEASHWTSLRFLGLARLIMIALLLVFVGLADGAHTLLEEASRGRFVAVASAYLALACAFLIAARRQHGWFHAQLGLQVLVDLGALTALMTLAGGVRGGLGVLIVGAVAGASVLSVPRIAAFFAAIATLVMFGAELGSGIAGQGQDAGALAQVGLTGLACISLGVGISWLAVRLDTQERLARRRGDDLRAQLAITGLVIAELRQGVVVLDAAARVRTMNRAARVLLGDGEGAGTALERLLEAARRPGTEADAILGEGEGRRHVRVRNLAPGGAGAAALPGSGSAVLIIEDLRELEERARQLKLASMGRLSASIAHEIRNPLAAIRHANALLAEKLSGALEKRLARIVEDNSVRIDRIVEDILAIARRERRAPERLAARECLARVVDELVANGHLEPGRAAVEVATDEPIAFDVHHLRQVLDNLLLNAARYATPGAGAIRVAWRRASDDRLELTVADDGPGLSEHMRDHLFEPFFTSEARGSGLGLYLARELCEANGASIGHEFRDRDAPHRNVFVIRPAS